MTHKLKFLVAAALLFISVKSFSQFSIFNIPVHVSYEAGYSSQLRHGSNFSNLNMNGIRMAALAELGLVGDFTVQTGAIYNWMQADRTQQFPASAYYYTRSHAHELTVPIYAGYSIPLFGDFRLFAFAGPSLQIGLSENRLNSLVNMTNDYILDGIYVTPGTSSLYQTKELNRLNIQLSAGGGIKWRRYLVKGGYDYGLSNINNLNTDKMYQGGWYIAAGVYF